MIEKNKKTHHTPTTRPGVRGTKESGSDGEKGRSDR